MEAAPFGAFGTITLLTVLFALLLTAAVLWVFLPVAVYGIRSALRDLLAAQSEANRLLSQILQEVKGRGTGECRRQAPDHPERLVPGSPGDPDP